MFVLIPYSYIVPDRGCNFQLQVGYTHISLLTVNSFWNNNGETL